MEMLCLASTSKVILYPTLNWAEKKKYHLVYIYLVLFFFNKNYSLYIQINCKGDKELQSKSLIKSLYVPSKVLLLCRIC